MVPVLQRNANSNMAADTSGTKIQSMCIYQSLIDGFRRVKEKSCFRSTPFPFSIPPSTMIILYHFSADKSISNSSSLARTSARKLDLKKQRQSWIHVLYSYRVMTRDSTYLCVKIKHLAKDYVKNGKSGRRVVVAKADHSMDAVYLSLSLSLFILSPRRSLKSIVERLFHIHSVHLGQRTRVTICRLSKRDRLRRRGYYAALSPSPACRSIRSIGSPILHQPDTTTTCVIYIYICVCIFVFLT